MTAEPTDEEPAADSWSGASGGGGSDTELTRAEFRGRARALFRKYLQAQDLGQLRSYQRAFIDRNEQLTPEQRYWLIVHLRYYERSVARGIEDPAAAGLDPFTDAELRRLEASTTSWR
jgi:hypothetical protein